MNLTKKIFLKLFVVFLLFTLVLNIGLSSSSYALNEEQKKLIENGIYYYDPNSASNDCTVASVTASNNKVYVVGDSYSEGLKTYITPKLTELGYEVVGYNGHAGRSISGGGNTPGQQSGLEAIKQDAEIIKSAGNILIILGTNPSNYDNDIPLFMKEINSYNGNARKFWVNVNNSKVSADSISSSNKAIDKHSSEFDYSVIDWFSATSSNRAKFIGGDSLHPSAEGYKTMTDLVATSFGQATSGGSLSVGNIQTAKTPEENAKQIWSYFIGKGFTPNQTAGIMGNLQAESAFMPDRIEGKAVEDGTDTFDPSWFGKSGYGLAQWTTEGRQKSLLKLAQERGVKDSDLLMQLDHIMNEFKNSHKTAYNKLEESETIRDATMAILIYYEAPRAKDSIDLQNQRVDLAESVLKKYGGIAGVTAGCNKSLVGGKGGYDIGSMVFYSQVDPKWKDSKYDECTIGRGGCGPTSMAMVIATLVDQSVTPVEIANYFAEIDSDGQCGTGWGVWDKVAEKYGLKFRSLGQDFDGANEVLNNGGLVVSSFGIKDDTPTLFTTGRHLMVIRKVDPDGTYYIADPIQSSTDAEKNNKGYSQSTLTERSKDGGALNEMWGFVRE